MHAKKSERTQYFHEKINEKKPGLGFHLAHRLALSEIDDAQSMLRMTEDEIFGFAQLENCFCAGQGRVLEDVRCRIKKRRPAGC